MGGGGGDLVVLDRWGRAGRRFPLAGAGAAATLGRAHNCDVRVLLPDVEPHHATIVVHANQSIIRNVGGGETLVNGRAVSVAALRHGDQISLGGRRLRWQYHHPPPTLPTLELPTLPTVNMKTTRGRAARRATAATGEDAQPHIRKALEIQHRASMPGNAGGKQVAIVQPQRRETSEHTGSPSRAAPRSPRSPRSPRPPHSHLHPSLRGDLAILLEDGRATINGHTFATVQRTYKRRNSNTPSGENSPSSVQNSPSSVQNSPSSAQNSPSSAQNSPSNVDKSTSSVRNSTSNARNSTSYARNSPSSAQNSPSNVRKSTSSAQNSPSTSRNSPLPKSSLQETTKATLWIESRKCSPRVAPRGGRGRSAGGGGGRKSTPLRLAVLRKAQSAQKMRVTKIEAPLKMDAMKQAALMLMAGGRVCSPRPAPPARPALLVKRPGGGRKCTGRKGKGGSRGSGSSGSRGSKGSRTSRGEKSVQVLEITDSTLQNTASESDTSLTRSPLGSPLLPSPRKSALKDPKAKKSLRKNESIKFDFSNLENHSRYEDDDVSMVTASSKARSRGTASKDTVTDDDMTLHYSDTSSMRSVSPSPRRSIHSRASRMLEKVGSPLKEKSLSVTHATLTPESPRATTSYRASLIVQKALDNSNNDSRNSRRTTKTLTDQSFDSTAESAFKTRTLSPRSAKNMESYSIVDLVSMDSNESGQSPSVYGSVGSTRSSSIMFGTPRGSSRKTRSTIDPSLLTSSTPYHAAVSRTRASTRSSSSPNIRYQSPDKTRGSASTRRSKSLTTPENSEETQKHISINSTRISRASRSRSRINDSDLQFLNSSVGDSESPKTSRRNTKGDQSIKSPSPKKPNPLKSPQRRSSPSVLSNTTQNTEQELSPRQTSGRKTKSLDRSTSQESPRATSSNRATRASQLEDSRISQASPRQSLRTSRSQEGSRTSTPRKSSRKSSPIKSPRTVSPRKSTRNTPAKKTPRKNILAKSPVNSPVSPTIFQIQDSPRSSKSPQKRPQTPQKGSSKKASPQKSPTPSPQKRASRSNLTLNITQTTEEGIVTPENQRSPIEVGTPMLSIQNLLDSSQSSFFSQKSPPNTRGSINIKRKTIGVLRSNKKGRGSVKSKSFTIAARKSLRSGGISPEAAASSTEEENVTPKSAVKLVQEAVKNKHSTAKKPQSKRSIIDYLNESDIVKQLFNSPVKRKLSQSMTEFSRKRILDDDELPRQRTRSTIALTGRTPDSSVLDNSDRYTPEHFVSPLSTPSNSPNLTGIKRLYTKNTPENDLSNIKGVKNLLRTPRTRKSIRNDLTQISGVKNIFAKSPKNRLSDVRVKEVFVASPRNDLRRVTGVKSLFQSEKKRKSPRNDLSDVRGVKKLFTRKSAANDLRNVSGVKKALQVKSPRNDLRDVRGMRRMFREEKLDDSAELSGVEELFNVSNVSGTSTRDPEALFDQLIGKPPIKAVYSKSFITKRPAKRKIRRNSLRKSIELITTNVEEWLQQELQKTWHKEKLDQSKKANISRELQKLATDTVEGNQIRNSRIRNSTLQKTTEDETKRIASEVYSAHTLPIKKRSFVEASLEKSANSTANRSANRSANLPLKKRLVVHSTPVKGRYDVTLNASDLGRVSPIHALDRTDGNSRSKQLMKPTPQKGKRATRTNVIEEPLAELIEEIQTSPPKQARVSTKRKTDKTNKSQAKRTTSNTNVEELKPVSPKPSRASKASKDKIVKDAKEGNISKATAVSPKTTGRRNQASVIEVQESKSLKGRRTKATEEVNESSIVEAVVETQKTRRTRNNTEKQETQNESPKKAVVETQKSRRTRNNTEKHDTQKESPKKAVVETQKTRRTRNNTEKQETQKESPKKAVVETQKTRRTRNNTEKQEPQKESPKKTRNTKDKKVEKEAAVKKIDSPKKGRNTNARNAKPPQTKESPKKVVQEKPSPKKTRGTRAKPSPAKISPAKPSPAKPIRSLRKKAETTEIAHTKKNRKSLVITKKTPVMTPTPAASKTRSNLKTKPETPKKTTRRNAKADVKTKSPSPSSSKVPAAKAKVASPKTAETKPKTPKATRARLVVAKTSPKLNPRGAKSTRSGTETDKSKKSSPVKQSPPKRGRRNADVTKTEPKKNSKETKKAETKKSEPSPPAKRSRSQKESEAEPPAKRGRSKKELTPQKPQSPKKTRGKVTEPVKPVKEVTTELRRGRKRKSTDEISTVPAKLAKNETKTTRGRRTKANVIEVQESKSLKGRRTKATEEVNESSIVEPVVETQKTRRTRNDTVAQVETKAKKVSPVKEKASTSKKEDKKEGTLVKTRGVRQSARDAEKPSNSKKETVVKSSKPVEKSVDNKTQGKKVPAAVTKSPVKKSNKVIASPAKAVRSTRSRRR